MITRSGRLRMMLLGIALTLAVVLVVALVAGRRLAPFNAPEPAMPATVHDLVQRPVAYAGHRVCTTGVVRIFYPGSPDEHFVVEQAGQDRVGLRDVPRATVVPLVGMPVTVEGVLRVEPDFGIALQVAHIAPLVSTPIAASCPP